MQVGRDERAIAIAMRESFRDHWGFVERPLEQDVAMWMHRFQNDPFLNPKLFFIAWDGDQPAGISLCYDGYYDDHELGWVSTLGVLRPWRRRGLGLALLQHSFCELYARGRRRAGLGVDASSLTGATRLYEKAGMRQDPQRRFANFEKELRSGVELGTQQVE
jgi:ribosomal protein S18 acetylase RimI-like enzyme